MSGLGGMTTAPAYCEVRCRSSLDKATQPECNYSGLGHRGVLNRNWVCGVLYLIKEAYASYL